MLHLLRLLFVEDDRHDVETHLLGDAEFCDVRGGRTNQIALLLQRYEILRLPESVAFSRLYLRNDQIFIRGSDDVNLQMTYLPVAFQNSSILPDFKVSRIS